MVGGYDFFKSEFNRAIQARRQPGRLSSPSSSSPVPLVGSPASVVDEIRPIEYPAGKSGKTWKPDKYIGSSEAPSPGHQAIEDSINVVAVKVQEQVGVRRTVEVARRFAWKALSVRTSPSPSARPTSRCSS